MRQVMETYIASDPNLKKSFQTKNLLENKHVNND